MFRARLFSMFRDLTICWPLKRLVQYDAVKLELNQRLEQLPQTLESFACPSLFNNNIRGTLHD